MEDRAQRTEAFIKMLDLLAVHSTERASALRGIDIFFDRGWPSNNFTVGMAIRAGEGLTPPQFTGTGDEHRYKMLLEAERSSSSTDAVASLRKIGTVGVVSAHGKFLQAHPDGEMHCSNSYQDSQETWIIYQIDWPKRLYAFQNQYSGHYMCKNDARCVISNRMVVGPWEQWTLLSGDAYGVPGRIAFRAYDGTIMGANPEGDDTDCGGEILAAGSPNLSEGAGNGSWPGWFYLRTLAPVTPIENGLAAATW